MWFLVRAPSSKSRWWCSIYLIANKPQCSTLELKRCTVSWVCLEGPVSSWRVRSSGPDCKFSNQLHGGNRTACWAELHQQHSEWKAVEIDFMALKVNWSVPADYTGTRTMVAVLKLVGSAPLSGGLPSVCADTWSLPPWCQLSVLLWGCCVFSLFSDHQAAF